MTVQSTPIGPGMGQCSVTGKVVSEDELVTINGQRVCAEGKAILLDRLKAGESLPGEREKPTVMRRFGCIFLDGLLIGIPLAIVNGMVTRANPGSFMIIAAMSLLMTAIQVIYFGQMHGSRGQTVGKMWGKLLVVNNADGSPISMGTAYLRAMAYTGIGFLSGLAALTGVQQMILVASVVVGVYGLVNVLFALSDGSRQRALHDRIAGTRVVQIG